MDTIYKFLNEQSLYVVLLIALIIWIGLFTYIFKIDKKLKKLETDL